MVIVTARLKAQIVKELLCVLRDPRARALLVAPPLMQLLVFSFAATLEVRNASIAVFDRDGGGWSDALVADIAAAGFVGRLETVRSAAALEEAVEQRRVLLAIDIPETFSRDVAAGRPAVIQVIADGRRANSGQVAVGYLERIAERFGARVRPGAHGVTDLVALRHWFNPNLIYRWFVVPGIAGILAMFIALIVTALSIARERELGTFDQLLVSPTTRTEIIVAKTVPAVLLGTTLGMLMAGAAVFLFGVPFTGSVTVLLFAMLLFILSVVGVGLMISSICATQQQAIMGTFALGVPMVLMSGFATPVENMPMVLQWIAEAIPLKHFLLVVQGSFLKSAPLADLLAHAWPMALIALITLAAATVLVRSRLQ
jgi:ABC-2 type transport system permease protein